MTHPYATAAYGESLAHWGKDIWVPAWNMPVVMRPIADAAFDVAGVYPFSAFPPDTNIQAGLDFIREHGAVSATFVLDDYHRPNLEVLRDTSTVLRPFKTHYINRPELGPLRYDTHHSRALKKALTQVQVKAFALSEHLPSWCALYDYLIQELKLTGLHAFPHEYHRQIAAIPGMVAIGGWIEDRFVSCHIWACDDKTAHSHLVASNAEGYEARAGFAVNDFSLRYFADKQVINFGGGAGNTDDPDDGLARFKRGFSNDTAQSYIAGIVLDETRYKSYSGAAQTDYFPAYRAPKP
ncbi:MAG: hypothetical protein SFT92_06850 [Rickettsiales bacterium]|nr:hypothetical protein [Rickettsiales bacterium]